VLGTFALGAAMATLFAEMRQLLSPEVAALHRSLHAGTTGSGQVAEPGAFRQSLREPILSGGA
jgi:hypothetical protein